MRKTHLQYSLLEDRDLLAFCCPAGTAIVDNNLVVRTAAFDYLGAGESETFSINYQIADFNGGFVSQVATVTVNGANDRPAKSPQLLTGASDPDGDELLHGVQIGKQVPPTEGIDNSPVTEGPLFFEISKYDDVQSLDLLTGASDPNGDELHVVQIEKQVSLPQAPETLLTGLRSEEPDRTGDVSGDALRGATQLVHPDGGDAFEEIGNEFVLQNDSFEPRDYIVQTQSNDHTPAIQSTAADFPGIDALEFRVLDQVIADLETGVRFES